MISFLTLRLDNDEVNEEAQTPAQRGMALGRKDMNVLLQRNGYLRGDIGIETIRIETTY